VLVLGTDSGVLDGWGLIVSEVPEVLGVKSHSHYHMEQQQRLSRAAQSCGKQATTYGLLRKQQETKLSIYRNDQTRPNKLQNL
jgi:hypothetical protein